MIDVAKVRDIFREQLRTYRPAPPLFHDGKDSFLADSVIEAIVDAVNEEHEKLSMKQDGYAANMIDLANRIAELEARPLWQLFHKLWTRDVGTSGYDKERWLELERKIMSVIQEANK
tara:strand:- start:690 stop:1040 length:351 start_codon:yes stop_codon:yes gene_type:complete